MLGVAREAKSVEEFRERVAKIHFNKCGNNCQHLRRYVEIFEKLIKLYMKKDNTIKMHVENLNDKFSDY